jgi:hypothetical protein
MPAESLGRLELVGGLLMLVSSFGLLVLAARWYGQGR